MTNQDPYDNPLHYRNTSGCLQAISTVLAFIVLAFIAVWLSACSSVKNTVQTDYRDSIRTEYRHDTCYLQIHDTTYVQAERNNESQEHTDIEFADGGGSVVLDSIGNLLRIENVRNMRLSKQETEQRQTILRQANEIQAYQARIDSLQHLVKSYVIMQDKQQNTADIKPKTSRWHTFLVWWFGITAALLLCYAAYKGFKLYRIIIGRL